ncbi:MAG: threonine synthase, partial [Deltaproteobacteria bacterium]
MNRKNFPEEIKDLVIPDPSGDFVYRCLGCGKDWGIDGLLYTCPECKSVLLIEDRAWDRLKKVPGKLWRQVFNYRKVINNPALKGIFLFYELIAPVIPLEDVVCLGEGHTPVVEANEALQDWVEMKFFVKNDGQNPSASFKDRGMASAFSFINYVMKQKGLENVLAVCASTGDTSASAALYAAYLGEKVKSVVLLPHGK